MSNQIDPQLHGPLSHPPLFTQAPAQGRYDTSGPSRLPPIDQTHQLPPLSNNAPLQQPYYRLPPASAPLHHPEQNPEFTGSAYDSSQSHHGYQNNERLSPSGLSVEDAKRSRACEACRGLKVRCDRDENDAGKPCRRCSKARRQCVITAPSRKRQKKSDSRVAELEKKIDELSANLKKQQGDVSSPSGSYGKESGPLSPPQSTYSTSTTTAPTPPVYAQTASWKRNLEDRTNAQATEGSHDLSQDRNKSRRLNERPDPDNYDMHDRPRSSRTDDSDATNSTQSSTDLPLDSVIEPDTATRIFDRYVADMATHLPAVMFEEGTTAAEVRKNRPVLFLAILDTASVGMLETDVQLRINEMLLEVYANSILRNGEKSLDLVQALMVSVIWYRPPKRYEQMNVYMLTHISALMALDFGMGRKLNASRNARVATNVGQAQTPKSFLRSDSVEARRTWLGCYFVCMNVSLSLRRPNFIRWNNYLDECIKVLESAPETLPSDKRLCQHVKLMHINEEVGMRFSMDDPSATIAISDPRVQFAIGAFEKRLEEWGTGVPLSQWDLSLQFSKNFSRLYMHEIALHNNHNIDDFRAPFTEESLKAPPIQLKSITPYHQGLLTQCLSSVHDMFATFSAIDHVTVKALPIFYFVRIAYAVVVLIKLRCAVVEQKNGAEFPFKAEDLRVEQHLDTLLHTFQRMANEDAFRPARMFMIIVSKLRDGFKINKANAADNALTGLPAHDSHVIAIEAGVPDRQRVPLFSHSAAGSKKTSRKSSTAHSVAASHASRRSEPVEDGVVRQQPYAQPPSHPQQPHQQHQQQQHPNYSDAQTPLHFLSEVATTDAHVNNMASSSMPYQHQPQHQSVSSGSWYSNQMPQEHSGMMMGGMEYGGNMDPAFEQAMDMTMSIGDGDLSSLFMESGNYGYSEGMVPEGHMGVYGNGGGGGSGGW